MRHGLSRNATVLVLLALTLSAFAAPARAQGVDLTQLQTFPGGADAQAFDINEAQQVVGMATTSEGVQHAFLQIPANGQVPGEILDLGTLPGAVSSAATGINNRGQVVGWSLFVVGDWEYWFYRAFLWSPSQPNGTTGSMVDLGTAPGGTGAVAYGINNNGQVVGYTSYPVDLDFDGLEDFRAAMWTPTVVNGDSGQMADLGVLPGHAISLSYKLNDSGVAIGWSYDAVAGTYEGFVWSPASPNGVSGTMAGIGVLAGDTSSFAYDINNSGQIVGESEGETITAVLWQPSPVLVSSAFQSLAVTIPRANGTLLSLGTFGGGASGAIGINSVGQVVGWFDTDAGAQHAYLWTPVSPNSGVGQAIDLTTLPGGDTAQARAINDAGQIVGISNIDGGEERPFILGVTSRPEGFFAPVNTDLLPEGAPCAPLKAYKRNQTIPLKMRIFSGTRPLGDGDVSFAPRIVALYHNGTALNVSALNLDSGSANKNSKSFRYSGSGDGTGHWMFNFSTKPLAVGHFTMVVEIPNGGRWSWCFTLR